MPDHPLPPDEDLKTADAAARHRTHPDPIVQGQTRRQFQDTDGEGGVGGSLDGLYWKDQGARGPAGTGPDRPRRNPNEVGQLQYERAHAELGDGSADFTGERAEEALRAQEGEPEVTESLTSSGVMDENLDLGAEAADNREDRRKTQKP